MDTREITAILEEIADYMELHGDNAFKVRSFRNGARALEGLGEDVGARIEAGTLHKVSGIGKTIEEVVAELVKTGRSSRLEQLHAEVPAGLLEMVRIPGLGPKKTKLIYDKLGIDTVEALEKACEADDLAAVPGLGKKSVEKILEAIHYRRRVAGRFLYVQVEGEAQPLLEYLREIPGVDKLEVGGSLRRRLETVKDIDILATVKQPRDAAEVMERFVSWPEVAEVVVHGETKSSVRLASGVPVDLRVVDTPSFPYALQYFSGSKQHNTALRGIAKEKGLKLNEYGLFEVADGGDKLIPCRDEAEIYTALGLDYVEPELRESLGEIDLARDHGLPKIIRLEDLRGVAHAHTTYSDGHNTLEEMADAAQAMGFEYLGITDHSKSAGYAGGLKEEAVGRQHREIDELNQRYDGLRIFKGIESDIRMDGSLDYSPEVLDTFDFVIAAVHSGFQLSEKEQTERVIRALEDPHTTFLAHPTGRLLLERDGYPIHMQRVLEAAGELGVAVEINAHPMRLDLDWRLGNFARKHGVKTAIHPDAHSTDGLHVLRFGVGVARKAGFEARDVVNTYTVGEYEGFLRKRK